MPDTIKEIQLLSRFQSFQCSKCGAEIRAHALEIYAKCPKCGEKHKCRGFGANGTEIQDVIDAVLAWAGTGDAWEAVLRRRDEIQAEEKTKG